MDFNCQKNFKDKNLTLILQNATEIYDSEGNIMHDLTTTFRINNYIKYNPF